MTCSRKDNRNYSNPFIGIWYVNGTSDKCATITIDAVYPYFFKSIKTDKGNPLELEYEIS